MRNLVPVICYPFTCLIPVSIHRAFRIANPHASGNSFIKKEQNSAMHTFVFILIDSIHFQSYYVSIFVGHPFTEVVSYNYKTSFFTFYIPSLDPSTLEKLLNLHTLMFTRSAVMLQWFYQMQNVMYSPFHYHTEHSLPEKVLCFNHSTLSNPKLLGTTYLFLIFVCLGVFFFTKCPITGVM